ncbi:response regulator transcription factor [Dyella sp. 2RAB6]|uniref:response regulator transcription factor n=1 Tax=Dyella sp. 2RAB6 TaxID=3232992 RepID=UPI003F913E83
MSSRCLQPQAGLIMVIDDNQQLCQVMGDYLEDFRYTVDYAHDGTHGMSLASQETYDVLVLDWMLPGTNGLEVCRSLRAKGYIAPILMLTGRTGVDAAIEALDAGADDFLPKPFALRELRGRLEALIRRHKRLVAPKLLQIADLTLDTGTYELRRGDQRLRVSPIGLHILALLMEASPRVVKRTELEHALWGDNPPPSDTLRSHMYLLRRTIDRPFATPLLHTVAGFGFSVADRTVANAAVA